MTKQERRKPNRNRIALRSMHFAGIRESVGGINSYAGGDFVIGTFFDRLSAYREAKKVVNKRHDIYPISTRMKQAFNYDYPVSIPSSDEYIQKMGHVWQCVKDPHVSFGGTDPFNDQIFFLSFEDGLLVNSDLILAPEKYSAGEISTDILAPKLRKASEKYILYGEGKEAVLNAFQNTLERIAKEGPEKIPVSINPYMLDHNMKMATMDFYVSLSDYVQILREGVINRDDLCNRPIIEGEIEQKVYLPHPDRWDSYGQPTKGKYVRKRFKINKSGARARDFFAGGYM